MRPAAQALVLGKGDVVLALDGDAHAAHRQHPAAHGAEDQRQRRQDLVLRACRAQKAQRPVGNDADGIGAAERQQL